MTITSLDHHPAGDTAAARPPPGGVASDRRLQWVPIRSLGERHRPKLAAHLRALSTQDRYLRFGYPASDEQIERYVEAIDFGRDEVFGVFNRRLELIVGAHLAFAAPNGEPGVAEFGVSVSAAYRGRGFGRRLFDNAMLRARNRGIGTLLIHALTANTAMLSIVTKAGAAVERAGAEASARLKLPPDDLRSHLDAAVEDAAAEIDFHFKSQARFVDEWLHGFDRAGATLPRAGADDAAVQDSASGPLLGNAIPPRGDHRAEGEP